MTHEMTDLRIRRIHQRLEALEATLAAAVEAQARHKQAAAELRRLHGENDLLASAADKLRALYREERTELLRQRDQATAQRDALLEVLRWIDKMARDAGACARAAIASVEETK